MRFSDKSSGTRDKVHGKHTRVAFRRWKTSSEFSTAPLNHLSKRSWNSTISWATAIAPSGVASLIKGVGKSRGEILGVKLKCCMACMIPAAHLSVARKTFDLDLAFCSCHCSNSSCAFPTYKMVACMSALRRIMEEKHSRHWEASTKK